MTSRKENVLILLCTLVLLGLLTWWRVSVLTLQEDTGPLPKGQRSLKAVSLHIESSVDDTWKELITAFELAHGIRIYQHEIKTSSTATVDLPELDSSTILLMQAQREPLWSQLRKPWQATPLSHEEITIPENAEPLTLIHYPETEADPNVTEVVQYLSGVPQLKVLYHIKEPPQP